MLRHSAAMPTGRRKDERLEASRCTMDSSNIVPDSLEAHKDKLWRQGGYNYCFILIFIWVDSHCSMSILQN